MAEVANVGQWLHAPYVGNAAFAHKGGMHVSAIRRHTKTYEHIEPETVGNHRRVLISDLSGRSNILSKIQETGLKFKANDPNTEKILDEIKELEHKGFQFEGADASFELLARRAMGEHEPFFELMGFRVIDEKRSEDEAPIAEATIRIAVDGKAEHTAALGNGPVNAMDNALRKALEKFYPEVAEVKLLDYKVRVIRQGGTGSSVRVLITIRRQGRDLGHRRRVAQHHRGVLAGPGGQHPVQTVEDAACRIRGAGRVAEGSDAPYLLLSLILLVWNAFATARRVVPVGLLSLDGPGRHLSRRSRPPATTRRPSFPPKAPEADPSSIRQKYLLGKRVDINKASLREISELPGISDKIAAAVVAERDRLGGFRSPEDLLAVTGIKEKRLQKILPFLAQNAE